MNRLQRKTRKAIFDAFSELLTRKSFSRITVQEIIDQADVGRTTFYAHFPRKEELLQELCAELFDHVFSRELEAELTHDFSTATDDLRAFVAHILYHLLDYGKRLIPLLTSENRELFQHYFCRHFNRLVSLHILSGNKHINTAVPQAFLIDHISASFVNTVRWWQKNNRKQTPEEIAQYFVAVIHPIVN